jgi:2'-hydroxyisoflavone reductase
MRVLILGGGDFVGRALVEAALASGHHVTTLTRSTPTGGALELQGDRTTPAGLDVLADRTWDVVLDTWARAPRVVQLSVSVLAHRAAYYGYVSTASVYREPVLVGADEEHPTVDADAGADTTDYAADKRGAELAVLAGFGPARSLLARAGVIVGPYENSGRLVWWLRRLASGGDVLAPAPSEAQLQYIDARDLAAWMVSCAEAGIGGAFNAISRAGAASFGELLDECKAGTLSTAQLVWVPPEFIVAQGISPWIELPFWLPPGPEGDSVYGLDTSRAAASGLTCRPIVETIADTWAWMQAGGTPRVVAGRVVPGLGPEKERAALAAWAAQSKPSATDRSTPIS